MYVRILGSCFLMLLLASFHVSAKVVLPSVFSDNMVLQQKDEVNVWGKAAANNTISIITSWNNKKYTVISDQQGNWKTKIVTPAAGGPYTITFNDGDKLTLQNVMIGEVWVCSGQSNMDMPVLGFGNQPVLHSNEILFDADNSNIRLIRYEDALSRTPAFDCRSTTWEVSDAKSAGKFSAVGYQFAQLLQRKLKVPVGMIMSSRGGTKIEAWMSENSLKDFPDIRIPAVDDTAKMGKNDPAVLFNAMVHPFLGYGIKGVIWYQGEANRANAKIYDQLMVSMVREWRNLWHRGDFPFYYVQIAPFKYKDTLAPLVREAQLKASTQIPNCGMVVTMDVGAEHSIHPPDKTTVSRRLAYWAMAKTYGMDGLACAGPVYQSVKINKETASITFTNVENGLTSFGKTLSAFEVAGEDKVFYPAAARIIRKGVVVHSAQVKQPVAVRYAFKDWAAGDLYNTEGLPAAPFRTDDW